MAEIELAHQALDTVGVPAGSLGKRVLILVARYRGQLERPASDPREGMPTKVVRGV